MKPILISFFLAALLGASNASASEASTLQKCEGIVNSFVRLKIDIEQAGLALNVQKGIVEICQKLIEAEKPKEEPKAEPVK